MSSSLYIAKLGYFGSSVMTAMIDLDFESIIGWIIFWLTWRFDRVSYFTCLDTLGQNQLWRRNLHISVSFFEEQAIFDDIDTLFFQYNPNLIYAFLRQIVTEIISYYPMTICDKVCFNWRSNDSILSRITCIVHEKYKSLGNTLLWSDLSLKYLEVYVIHCVSHNLRH